MVAADPFCTPELRETAQAAIATAYVTRIADAARAALERETMLLERERAVHQRETELDARSERLDRRERWLDERIVVLHEQSETLTARDASLRLREERVATTDTLLTLNQAAKTVGVSRRTIFAWRANGTLPVVTLVNGLVRVRRSDLFDSAPARTGAQGRLRRAGGDTSPDRA